MVDFEWMGDVEVGCDLASLRVVTGNGKGLARRTKLVRYFFAVELNVIPDAVIQ